MPPLATARTPAFLATAPEKAPRSWPNSSLRSRSRVRSAQLIGSQRRPAPGAQLMDGRRHQLLAGPRLALYQNRYINRRHAADLPEERLHRGAPADDSMEGGKVRSRHRRPAPVPPVSSPADRETPSHTWGTP